MISLRALFLSWISLTALVGCGSDDRAGTAIPPLPEVNATSRRATALKLLNNLAARNPRSSGIFYQRARLYLEAGQPTQALDDINRALDIQGAVGNYFQVKALALRALNRTPEALEAARQVEILEAGTPELYVLLGDLYQQTGQFGPARSYLNRAMQATPFNGEACFFSGLVTAKTGDTTQALPQFRRALTLNPGYVATYQQLASIYNSLGDTPSAIEFSERGLRRFPNDATLLYQRGRSFQQAQQPDSALLCYRKVVAIRPQFFEASFNAGLLSFRQNDLTGALQFFEQVLKYNPRVPLLNFYIGQCFEYLGNAEKALEFYTLALETDPSDFRAANGHARMKRRLELPYGEADALTSTRTPIGMLKPLPRRIDTALFRPIRPHTNLSSKSDSGGRLVPRLQTKFN